MLVFRRGGSKPMDDSERVEPGRMRHKRKLNLPGASNLPVLSNSNGLPTSAAADARCEIDKRIATAPVADLPALIQARGAIIEQDEYQREGTHLRRGQMGVFYSKIGFSIVAVAGGAGLIATGFAIPGFFLLGSAAAIYVPDYVKNVVDKFGKGDGYAG